MPISVQAFLDECSERLRLRLLAGESGMGRGIAGSRVQEAGLAIAGEVFPSREGLLQVLGETEVDYFRRQDPERQPELAERFFAGPLPCAVVVGSLPVPTLFVEAAERASVPLFASDLPAAGFLEEAGRQLYRLFTETTTVYGVLLEVIGVGVLLSGRSGIGKSECALDLVLRGHRLVADDMIHVDKLGPATLVGRGNDLTSHNMEIRGLGIINVRDLFGATATTRMKKMELVIRIEEWDSSREYDRLGLEDETIEILGVRLPSLLIPISPGRNLATIVEVAARNHLLKQLGVHSARHFVDRQARRARGSGSQ
ncbi:HPr(Ser) kinase/phosphatase [Candidatus Deferrimicrobium sp.]|uniref:HPr(Ser) kinase/phosphatase n=1 Tax=Candidatus Deferrimicrobium sp. TaxID=3060586 RepID=UPI002ED68A33